MNSLGRALALVALSFAALATFGAAGWSSGAGGAAAAELACVLLPAWMAMRWGGLGGAALELRGSGRAVAADCEEARPVLEGAWQARAVLGGLLAGAAGFYALAAGLEPWLESLWPTPAALQEAMQRLVLPAAGPRPLALDLVALALIPAVSEELLFRGLLWSACVPRLGRAGTVAATALLFGLYHGSPHRLLPAAAGGLVLGLVRAGTATLAPAMAAHFAHNAAALLALRHGLDPLPRRPAWVTAAVLTGAMALVLIRWRRCAPCSSSPPP